jgi:hypothetical protein
MNEADLNNAFKYDKIILSIDGKSCLSTNSAKSSYYLDLLEPLRNVVYIKILNAKIMHNSSITSLYNYVIYDPIYISINDYNRSKAYLKKINIISANTSNILLNSVEYFDSLYYGSDGSGDVSLISYTQSSFDWTDPTVYILNPPEPNLRRLNIEIKDKTFNLFNTTTVTNFNLTICIYFMKNRV